MIGNRDIFAYVSFGIIVLVSSINYDSKFSRLISRNPYIVKRTFRVTYFFLLKRRAYPYPAHTSKHVNYREFTLLFPLTIFSIISKQSTFDFSYIQEYFYCFTL